MTADNIIARVDGLPVVLLERERIWPVPASTNGSRSSAWRARAARRRTERQTAVVHECRLPAWAKALMAEQAAEEELLEIRAELNQAGLL